MIKVALFPNKEKKNVHEIFPKVIEFLQSQNVSVYMLEEDANIFKCPDNAILPEKIVEEINFGLVLGGDGTMLDIARELAMYEIPVCGINLGKLGFLNEINKDNFKEDLKMLINGEYFLEKRIMLEAAIKNTENYNDIGQYKKSSFKDTKKNYALALNDVVLNKSGLSRLLSLSLYVNNSLVANYSADGLIVATPTGSTGYSLSAGGPIINPTLNVLVVTPICPHSLNDRPLIISDQDIVTLKANSISKDVVLSLDGQRAVVLGERDEVIIRKAPFTALFMKMSGGKSYYETLKSKMWQS